MKKMLIGTVPPPAGGDATWAESFLKFFRDQGEFIPLVNTSLIGRRALIVDDRRFYLDEIKRCLLIWVSILRNIKKFSPDIVHMNINCSPFGIIRDLISAIIVKLSKKKLILHCHCNVGDQIGEKKIICFLLRCLLNIADGVIVLNSKSYNYVRSISNVRLKQIPNFISEKGSEIMREISDEIRTVLYVGHIRKSKGIDEILEVAKLFPQYRFVLAGPITDDYSQYLPETMYYNIFFTGSLSHENVVRQMDMADVFLFPSYTEGFSIALLEAMSRGLPCIATDVGANADMLEKQGGMIVVRNNVESITNALICMKTKIIRKKMSEWNIAKVRKCYTIESVVKEIEVFYEEVLNEQT